MFVTFLGTGTSQGIPVIACDCEVCRSVDFRNQRLRVSVHIEVDNQSIVIDSGPDFRQQMLRASVQHLDALIFTHEHKDHTAGMDDIRAFNYKQNGSYIPVFASERVIKHLQKEFAYIFETIKYPGIPQINTIPIENKPFFVGDVKVVPIEVMHHQLPVFGYRIGDFTYITDANFIAEEEIDKIMGSKVLVINALQKEKHISHYNLDEALEVIYKIQPEKAYLTHLGHRMGLHADIEKELPPNVYIAYDGLKIQI
ncbi:MAG: MBL fold metallo-hydrolase [Verrucomicrobia bacterium]|nr:MBL fold metallo-hydrolase [Cytophagales bacterium]